MASVTAYRQGVTAPVDGFKLSSNENPFDPLPEVVEQVRAAMQFNRYANADMQPLRGQLAARFGVSDAQVHIAPGSVSILYQLVHATCEPGDEVIFAWPSFEAYPALGLAPGAVPIAISLTGDQHHDLEAMLDAVTERTRVILLCTPNNPTGTVIRRDAFDSFMSRVPKDVLVVLDEAYREFVTDADAVLGESVLAEHPQLILLRTFSKAYGLAGLRIGYAVGDERILNAARAVGIPLAMTETSRVAAEASLAAEPQLLDRINELAVRREALSVGLRELGFEVTPSEANFVWLPLGDRSQAFTDTLAEDGLIVRPFGNFGVRISVGEPESIPRIIAAASRFSAAQ